MEMRKNIILLSMFFLNISCAQKLKLDAPSCNVFVNISNKKEKLKNRKRNKKNSAILFISLFFLID